MVKEIGPAGARNNENVKNTATSHSTHDPKLFLDHPVFCTESIYYIWPDKRKLNSLKIQ